jgi:osmotically-inducible protein OsmY
LNTDHDIERSIRSKLRTLPRIDESNIGVQVEDAIVTLTGFVGSLRERVEAECAAQRVASVLGIANEIQVAPTAAERLGDSYIVREAVAAIRTELAADAAGVQAIVRDRFVTLEGDVADLAQRERIEAGVRAIAGIAGVTNLIAVRAPGRQRSHP